MSRGRTPTVMALAVVALTAVALPALAQPKTALVFSAGPTGGTWTPMAGATAEVIKRRFPELDVQVEPGAALVNMEKIRNDKADLGWSQTNVLSDALHGKGQWDGKKTDRPMYVATFYPNVWQLAVPADSDIRSVKDLKGKPVVLPARGNTSLADGWELLLKVYDMKLDDLGPKSYGPMANNVEGMKDRKGTAIGWFTVVPGAFMLDLGSTMKLRLLPVSDGEFAKIKQINPGFQRHVIKAGTYAEQGEPREIQTFQAPTILIASSKASADTIYKVTKAVVEGRADFVHIAKAMTGITPKDMGQDYGFPFHPGAAKYYKEIGVLK